MAKTPQSLIKEARKEIKSLMEKHLQDISPKIISDILTNYNKLSGSKKQDATKNIKAPAGQNYKIELREAMAVIARESINMAKKEVPSNVNFAEFEKLPPVIRNFIDAQAAMYVNSQIDDLKKKTGFTFQDNLLVTQDEEQLRKAMAVDSAVYATGTAVTASAGKFVANTVNNSRKAYFDNPEVSNQIEAFQYKNIEPNAAICVSLKDHIFAKDDPDLAKFTPPFHFNCDGWLRPILVGNLRGKEPSKFVPSKKAQESMQFSEKEEKNQQYSEPDSFDPPKQARANAKRGLELRRTWNRGGTEIGVARARDLSNGRSVSRETVGRMASFNRHRDNADSSKRESDGGPSAGHIAWLLWGGTAGVDWATGVMDSLNKKELQEDTREDNLTLQSIIITKDFTDDRERAIKLVKELGGTVNKIDETKNSFRFRQEDPNLMEDNSFRSKVIKDKGAILIYGQLK